MNLIDWLLPAHCVNCGKFGQVLCQECQKLIEYYSLPVDSWLKTKQNFTHIYALGFYQPPLTTLIKTLKYQSIKEIAAFLGKLLFYQAHYPAIDLVSYVPAGQDRIKQRGFNQAQLIAQKFADLGQWPCLALFNKKPNQIHQASLTSYEQRLTNMQQGIELKKNWEGLSSPVKLKNKKLLIIDDVVTTGATLSACANCLTNLELEKIFGLCLTHRK